jgi:hypothetical protein
MSILNALGQDRQKSVMLFYGASATGKTTTVESIIAALAEQGYTTRYLTADTGGYEQLRPYAEAGIVDIFPLWKFLDAPGQLGQSIIRAVARGYWPIATPDGSFKFSPHIPSHNQLLVVEGLDGIGKVMERTMVETEQKVGTDPAYRYEIESLAEGLKEVGGKIGLSHYGAIQTEYKLYLFPAFASLPYPYTILTGHEGVTTDKDGLSPTGKIYAPLVAPGKALAPEVAQSVAMLIRFDTTPSGEYRAYFEKHPDPEFNPPKPGAIWPANARVSDAVFLKLKERYPQGFVKLEPGQKSFWEFLQFRESLVSAHSTSIINKFHDFKPREDVAPEAPKVSQPSFIRPLPKKGTSPAAAPAPPTKPVAPPPTIPKKP